MSEELKSYGFKRPFCAPEKGNITAKSEKEALELVQWTYGYCSGTTVKCFEEDKVVEKLSDEDKNAIAYFILEKGDVTRWASWEKKKDLVRQEFPELILTLDVFTTAEKTLDRIANDLAN